MVDLLTAWLEALEDLYPGKEVDPLVRKILEEVCRSAAEGATPGQIVRKLSAGALFSVKIDRATVKAIVKHNKALGDPATPSWWDLSQAARD